MIWGNEDTQTLRREVRQLRAELAQERARADAMRIAHEAELADAIELRGEGGAPAPLLYALCTDAHDSHALRMHVGDKDITVVVGPGQGELSPAQIWAIIQRIANSEDQT